MEKKRKRKEIRRIFGLTIGEVCAFVTVLGAVLGSVAAGVHYLDGKFERIDRRFESVDRKFERIETRLDNIEVDIVDLKKEITKTGNLLDQYLTWRFICINDPVRKDLVPLYDPVTRTIEFVDRKSAGK
jgi:hypothetical protein